MRRTAVGSYIAIVCLATSDAWPTDGGKYFSTAWSQPRANSSSRPKKGISRCTWPVTSGWAAR